MLFNVLVVLLYLILLPAFLLVSCLLILGVCGVNLWHRSFKIVSRENRKKRSEKDAGVDKYYKREKFIGDDEGEYVEYIEFPNDDKKQESEDNR